MSAESLEFRAGNGLPKLSWFSKGWGNLFKGKRQKLGQPATEFLQKLPRESVLR
jgi:hypothetical protein